MKNVRNGAIDLTSPPVFLETWKLNLQIVNQSIQRHPLLVGLLLASSVVHAIFPLASMLASLAAMISLTFIEYTIIRAVWSNIHDGVPNYVVTDTNIQWLMTVTLILANFIAFLLALLLILPGGWYFVKSCLALMAVCLENKTPVDAIKRSHELTKGHFARTFVTCFGAPFLLTFAFAFMLLFCILIIMVPANLISDQLGALVKIPVQIVLTMMLYGFVLTMKPPLVHLFAFLTNTSSQNYRQQFSIIKQTR